jgi:hypothetical protein
MTVHGEWGLKAKKTCVMCFNKLGW